MFSDQLARPMCVFTQLLSQEMGMQVSRIKIGIKILIETPSRMYSTQKYKIGLCHILRESFP